jgi:lipopolysaccharide transport system ATP-binding protein
MTKKEISEKLDEIVAFSGCERYVDTPVKRYSSGMKVRLAFAVAAHLEPDILIVDEVLAVGDAEFQKKAIGKMQDISSQGGRTVLFVSHDMAAIQSLCNRLIVLINGGIGYDGAVTNGMNYYLSIKNLRKNNNFEEIKKRSGHGETIFSSVEFSYLNFDNKLYENIKEVPSGVKLLIDVYLKSKYFVKQKKIFISLKVNDTLGIPVTNFSNEFTDDSLFIDAEITRCRFEIDQFNLRKGEYVFSFWGTDKLGCFDSIEDTAFIEVIPSDFFGTGKYPMQKKHGAVLMKSKQYNL